MESPFGDNRKRIESGGWTDQTVRTLITIPPGPPEVPLSSPAGNSRSKAPVFSQKSRNPFKNLTNEATSFSTEIQRLQMELAKAEKKIALQDETIVQHEKTCQLQTEQLLKAEQIMAEMHNRIIILEEEHHHPKTPTVTPPAIPHHTQIETEVQVPSRKTLGNPEHADDTARFDDSFFCLCGRGYSSHCNLRAHFRTCTPVKKFKCYVCKQGFDLSTRLRQHQRDVHRIDTAKSFGCRCTFSSRPSLDAHRKNAHSHASVQQETSYVLQTTTPTYYDDGDDDDDDISYFEEKTAEATRANNPELIAGQRISYSGTKLDERVNSLFAGNNNLVNYVEGNGNDYEDEEENMEMQTDQVETINDDDNEESEEKGDRVEKNHGIHSAISMGCISSGFVANGKENLKTKCRKCGNIYKSMKLLRKHEKLVHNSWVGRRNQGKLKKDATATPTAWYEERGSLSTPPLSHYPTLISIDEDEQAALSEPEKYEEPSSSTSLAMPEAEEEGESLHAIDLSKQGNVRLCRQGFPERKKLNSNIQCLTEKWNFHCTICGKPFFCISKLQSHMKLVHDEEQEDNKGDVELSTSGNICEYSSNCQRSLSTPRKRWIQHAQQAKHGKDFSRTQLGHFCICGKDFKSNKMLKFHVSYLTKEPNVPCLLCRQRFISPSYLKKHMNRVHRPGEDGIKLTSSGNMYQSLQNKY